MLVKNLSRISEVITVLVDFDWVVLNGCADEKVRGELRGMAYQHGTVWISS